MRTALITGAGGQDGTLLTKYLSSIGYKVWAGVRHYSKNLTNYNLVYVDIRDYMTVETAIRKSDPDEIYNFGAQSFVPPSWSRPDVTLNVNVGGLARILEVVEKVNPKIKVYQASSSEMFGNAAGFLNENSPMHPTSPYGVSKLAAHNLCSAYRAKGLFACSGICFNHESEYRGEEMVTRKITKKVAQWVKGDKTPIKLGSLDTRRDWGYAADYVEAMHAMLQLDRPDDYVIATGESHSVKEFLDEACSYANVEPIVEIDPRFIRTGEIHDLVGDSNKAYNAFGFTAKTDFKQLVKIMVDADIDALKG